MPKQMDTTMFSEPYDPTRSQQKKDSRPAVSWLITTIEENGKTVVVMYPKEENQT